jgi:hypothetical protein
VHAVLNLDATKAEEAEQVEDPSSSAAIVERGHDDDA